MKNAKMKNVYGVGLLMAVAAGCGGDLEKAKKKQLEEGEVAPVAQASPAAESPVATLPADGKESNNVSKTTVASASGLSLVSGGGEVIVSRVKVSAGQALRFKGKSSQSSALTSFGLVEEESEGNFEVSIVNNEGVEKVYSRISGDKSESEFVPSEDGEILIAVKNNSKDEVVFDPSQIEGGSVLEVENASTAVGAHKDIALKSVVVFARNCKQQKVDGSGVDVFNAPAGEYYVQPFVFLGKVKSDKSVERIESATLKVTAGDKAVELKTLSALSLANFKEHSSLSKEEHIEYTRAFYQSYLGGAGELYTVDTFQKKGDCKNAVTLPIDADPAKSQLALEIVDESLAIDESIKLRPSVSTAFSMYETEGVKLQDYTQCTYNRLTAEPMTYNGEAGVCKEFSFSKPPYVTLDYLMPSQIKSNNLSPESDPTRILYYGVSSPKTWLKTIVENSAEFASGKTSDINLEGCMYNGGLVSLPISSEQTTLPLREFNAKEDDVIMLSQRTGSHTALLDFYQGNVVLSGKVKVPTCIPSKTESCAAFKLLTVSYGNCEYKADSGVSVTSISDDFIFPDAFRMSGVVKE